MKQIIHNIAATIGTLVFLVPVLALFYSAFYPNSVVTDLFIRCMMWAR